MSTLISDFKTRIQQKIHGRALDKVQDVYGLIYEASNNLKLAIDPKEMQRIEPLTNAVYDDVYSYACPSDLKGDGIVDVRPQVNRSIRDNFHQTYAPRFDRIKAFESLAVENDGTLKTLRLNSSKPPAGPTVNALNSVTENGTWAADSTYATDITTDQINYVAGSGSVRFNLAADAGSQTGYIENSTMTAVDLSDIADVGALFAWVYLPTASNFTSVSLRWGSSTSDYYSVTATTTHVNSSFVNGWNLLRFDWPTTVASGTPVDTAIDYLRVSFVYNGTAMNGVRVDNIVARNGVIFDVVYNSDYMFRNSSGTWIIKPTADTDLLNLETEAENMLLYEVAFLIAQEVGGEDASFDVSYFKAKRDEVWGQYMRKYKSQRKRPRSPYYRMP